MDLKEFESKKVKIFLKNKKFYNGVVEEVSENKLKIRDRYLGIMMLDIENIDKIFEDRDRENVRER